MEAGGSNTTQPRENYVLSESCLFSYPQPYKINT